MIQYREYQLSDNLTVKIVNENFFIFEVVVVLWA